MNTGELATRWTVRAALVLYALALAVRANARGRQVWLTSARLLWTGGFVVFVVHVACAFHFYHHWSHAAAYADTAEKTAAVTGLNWGGGVYINYIFALMWGVDAAWWWRDAAGYQTRSRAIEWSVQGFMAFIAFNATVVFGMGAIRWAGMAGFSLLALGLGVGARRRMK